MSWIFYAFLAALSAAVVNLLAKVGIAGIDSTLATSIRGISIAVFMGGAALLMGKWQTLASTSPKTLFFIVLTGVFGGLSWLWGFMALKAGGDATAVNAIDKLSLVFLLILAVLFLNEHFTWAKFYGVILIVIGTLLVSFKPEQWRDSLAWIKSLF
ncbi:MAG: EamA family transporter [Candidatus Moraniibacteriota bacterium]